jgi:hypothetical protein
MRSGASGAGCLDASFAVSAMRARECRLDSALSIICAFYERAAPDAPETIDDQRRCTGCRYRTIYGGSASRSASRAGEVARSYHSYSVYVYAARNGEKANIAMFQMYVDPIEIGAGRDTLPRVRRCNAGRSTVTTNRSGSGCRPRTSNSCTPLPNRGQT